MILFKILIQNVEIKMIKENWICLFYIVEHVFGNGV